VLIVVGLLPDADDFAPWLCFSNKIIRFSSSVRFDAADGA
jgi:hypothetical protein